LIKNGTKTVSYNLYKDSAYTQILGTGSGSTYTFSKAYSLKKNKSQTDSFPIYGKIPVQPMAVPGFVYTDTITATLTY
jgi:spore coat protein U-like protein